MKQRGKYSYRGAVTVAGLAGVLWLLSKWLLILANIACFLFGSVFLIWVLNNRKKISPIWFFGPLSILIFLGGIELGLHFGPLKHRFLPMGIGKDYKTHPLLFWIPKELVKQDKAVEQKSNTTSIRIEDYGNEIAELMGDQGYLVRFRSGPAPLEKRKDCFRIVSMGGSNAWGDGIKEYGDTLSGVLQVLLKKAYPQKDIEVISAGVPGYCLFQNLIFYQLVIRRFKPDLVILYANINEPGGEAPFTLHEYFQQMAGVDPSKPLDLQNGLKPHKGLIAVMHESFHRLNTYNMMTEGITRMRNRALKDSEAPMIKLVNPVSDYRRNLVNLIQVVRNDGTRLLLADAFSFQAMENESFGADLKKYRTAMKETAEKYNIPFLQIHDTLAKAEDPAGLVLEFDQGHINEKGHRKAAEIIFEAIQTNQLIDRK